MTNALRIRRLIPFGFIAVLILASACDPQPEATTIPVASATPTPRPASLLEFVSAATPTPLVTATPTALPPNVMLLTPVFDGQTLTFDTLPEPYPLDVYSLAQQFLPDADLSPPNVPRDEVGDVRSFFVYNLRETSQVEIDTRLCVSTEHVDFYLGENLGLTCAAFRDDVTRRIEEVVRPTVIANFAGDPTAAEGLRIAIVHANIPGFGGYFDASDLYPTEFNPHASGRYTLYLNAAGNRSGNPRHATYASLVAHELQHAIHHLSDPDESTWVNEGLSVLAEDTTSTTVRANYFLNSCPPTQLMAWSSTPGTASCNYSAAGLFMRYLRDNYPGPDGTLRQVVAQPANGLRGIDAYLAAIDANVDTLALMARWGVANYLDGRSNRDFYTDFDAQARATSRLSQTGELSRLFTQFAAEYIALPLEPGVYQVSFMGDTTTPLLPDFDNISGSFWLAGSEDSTAYSLTHEFDLRAATLADDATLTLLLRYHIEENWDYLYATVSTDDGQTWQVLQSPSMQETSDVAFGSVMFDAGFTGTSGNGAQPQWVLEELDLSGFIGERILFRLLYLTDQSISLDGVSLAGAWLPAADYGWAAINHPVPVSLASRTTNEQPDGGWTPDGFFFSNNRVQQNYAVRLMTVDRIGDALIVRVPVIENAGVTINFDNSDGSLAHAALMVMPLAPQTRQSTHAMLTIRPVSET